MALSRHPQPRLLNLCRMASGALPAQPAACGELEELQATTAALQGTALQRQQEVVTARRSTAALGAQASCLNRNRRLRLVTCPVLCTRQIVNAKSLQ